MRAKKSDIFKALVIISVTTLLVVNSKSIANQSRVKFVDFISPVLKTVKTAASSVRAIIPFATLREENRILRERINLLNRRIDELKVLSAENDRLKTLLAFRKSVPYSTIPAQVIGRDPTNWSNSIIIDKGSLNGLRENRPVLFTKGLVGRLIEIGRTSAKVLLITDPNSKVGVLIERNRQGGILAGRPDGRCKVVYIALDSDVAPGDKVITAGFGSVFPKDIMVGVVTRVGKEPGRLYKYAIVKTAEDLSKLEEVLCIR
ncbi:MAG: rod shape-determining protein MreC [Candidatus Omnitrophica bacterium]|nr:rod shape-determining protein MreC [Candidatus Omnitrophota bacterium]